MAGGDHHQPEVGPFVIGILGMLARAIVVATYHCIVVGCYQIHSRDSTETAAAAAREEENVEGRSTSSSSGSSNSSAALIPVVKYSKEERSLEASTTCSVCLSDFSEGEPVRALPVCSHVFHAVCIDRWLLSHPNCPVCRANTVPVSHVALTVSDRDGSGFGSGSRAREGSQAAGRLVGYFVI